MKISKIINNIIPISFLATVFMTIVNFCCFDINYFLLKNDSIVSYDSNTINSLIKNVLLYIKGDDIQIQYFNILNENELKHIIDLKDIYNVFKNIYIISFILLILGIILFFIFDKNITELIINYKKYYKKTLLTIIFILIWIVIDFDSFWDLLHRIIFIGKSTWSFDPKQDLLINIMPASLFFGLLFKILIVFIFISSIFYLILYIISRKKNINDKCSAI